MLWCMHRLMRLWILILFTIVAADESCTEFFGAPQEREDEWLRWFDEHPVPALQNVAEALRAPATDDVLADAWREADAVEKSCEVIEALGRLLFRHFQRLPLVNAQSLETELRRCGGSALEAAAGLLLLRDGTKTAEAIHLLGKSKGRSGALRLAVARHSNGDKKAVADLARSVKQEMDEGRADGRLLSMFGFLAATSGHDAALATSALQAAEKGGSRHALEAILYSASMRGSLPFPLCQRIFLLERDLLYQPSSCLHRLELAVLLQQAAAALKEEKALRIAEDFLSELPFQCPGLASELSGMGISWLQEPNAKTQTKGLAGDLYAVSAIRLGIRAANYALWSRGMSGDRSSHEEVLRAAEALQQQQQPPKPPRSVMAPPLLRPSRADGCPEVTREEFPRKCLRPATPCVLRQAASMLLQPGADTLERWLDIAGNATVKVSFPFEAKGVASLNRIMKTAELPVKVSNATTWTLLRPGSWHMRFSDALDWARRHPQEIYMNQVMLADLGREALEQVTHNAFGMKLLQPSLWLSSGPVATGYHVDGPENLLLQLTGTKEIGLLRPSEESKLQYQEVVDAEQRVNLTADGTVAFQEIQHTERRSRGHSVLDVAALPPDVPEDFLDAYKQATGIMCHIGPGDVLYIPSGWHHAVFTTPDETSTALSLNLWYHQGSKKVRVRSEAKAAKTARSGEKLSA